MQYVKAIFALGQSDSAVRSPSQQYVAYDVLVDLDVLSQPVDLVVVGQYAVLYLALFPNAPSFRARLLQISLGWISRLFAEGRQSLDCFDEVDAEKLVVDGRLAALVSFQVGKITRVGCWVGSGILDVICLLRCMKI